MMNKEPIDYLIDVISWGVLTPYMILHTSGKKSLRVIGKVLCLPFIVATCQITLIPLSIVTIILLIAQMFYDE